MTASKFIMLESSALVSTHPIHNCFLFLRKCTDFWDSQSIQCLLCKHQSPGIGKTRTSYSSLASPISEFQAQWGTLSAKLRWKEIEEDSQPLSHSHQHYTHVHHTQIQFESVFQIHISSLFLSRYV